MFQNYLQFKAFNKHSILQLKNNFFHFLRGNHFAHHHVPQFFQLLPRIFEFVAFGGQITFPFDSILILVSDSRTITAKMVKVGKFEEEISNFVFIVPAIIVLGVVGMIFELLYFADFFYCFLIGFVGYKLYNSIQAKQVKVDKKSKKSKSK